MGSSSGPGIVVVGTIVSGPGVGSSSEPGIVISGAGSGSDSEVSNGDVVVGAVDSEDCGSEDSGAEVGVDASAAWVGSDVGTLVAGLVAELEGSADWEDEEVAVGVLAAAIWGAGSELEDGVEAGVV